MKSLYDRVTTAEIGQMLKYNGKTGTVCLRTGRATCSRCIYHGADTCSAEDEEGNLPCLAGSRFDGRVICVMEEAITEATEAADCDLDEKEADPPDRPYWLIVTGRGARGLLNHLDRTYDTVKPCPGCRFVVCGSRSKAVELGHNLKDHLEPGGFVRWHLMADEDFGAGHAVVRPVVKD